MFKLEPISDNIFMVIKEDALSEDGTFYKKLPIEVYGFIRINYQHISGPSVMNISEELSASGELIKLQSEAKRLVRENSKTP